MVQINNEFNIIQVIIKKSNIKWKAFFKNEGILRYIIR